MSYIILNTRYWVVLCRDEEWRVFPHWGTESVCAREYRLKSAAKKRAEKVAPLESGNREYNIVIPSFVFIPLTQYAEKTRSVKAGTLLTLDRNMVIVSDNQIVRDIIDTEKNYRKYIIRSTKEGIDEIWGYNNQEECFLLYPDHVRGRGYDALKFLTFPTKPKMMKAAAAQIEADMT